MYTINAVMESLKNDGFIKLIDDIIPLFRLNYTIVSEIRQLIEIKENLSNISFQNLEFHIWTIDDCITFFKDKSLTVPSILLKLNEHNKIKLLDLIIVLTLFTKGPIKDKCNMLYNFFAVSEPEGLLEREHVTMLIKTVNCLVKIGVLKSLDFTEDDAKHIAFLGRICEDGSKFYPSLSFQEFYAWVSNSTEVNAIFKSVRLLNRLLEICITLDNRAVSVSHLLNTIKSLADNSNVVKSTDSSAPLGDSYVIYRGISELSFILFSADWQISQESKDFFIQIEKRVNVPRPFYVKTKRLADRSNDRARTMTPVDAKSFLSLSQQPVHFAKVVSNSVISRIDVIGLKSNIDQCITLCSTSKQTAPINLKTSQVVFTYNFFVEIIYTYFYVYMNIAGYFYSYIA
jgi:hypothetical protein